MAERAAIDTIRGYFYQFDYSISRLLELTDDNSTIVVEGIEDVDIKTANEETAIQCKYYAKTEYNHSVIAEPVRLILNHFKEVKAGTKSKLKYKLRGFYKSGQDKLTLPISVQFLKNNFLTYIRSEKIKGSIVKVKHFHHSEIELDDAALEEFITLLEIDINAKGYEDQFNDILAKLRTIFDCSQFMAEYLYYNNALGIIRKLSKEHLYENRRITKGDFLKRINNRKVLFNEWFVGIKGEKAHFENLRKEYFGSVNILYKERYFLIEAKPDTYSRGEIKDVINHTIRKFTKIIKQPHPFCPYIYLHGINATELIEIKRDLIEDGILIHDGFDFEGSSFNPESLYKRTSVTHPIKVKFLNDLQYLNQVLVLSGRKSEIYQFYQTDSFFDFNNPSVKEIKIQVTQLKNIKSIV